MTIKPAWRIFHASKHGGVTGATRNTTRVQRCDVVVGDELLSAVITPKGRGHRLLVQKGSFETHRVFRNEVFDTLEEAVAAGERGVAELQAAAS